MANARGGIVIIGVEDSTHKVVGVPAARIGETMDVVLRAAWQVIKPELVLDPPEPEIYVLAGKKLLVVTIPSTDGPVYQAGGIFGYGRELKYALLRAEPTGPYPSKRGSLCVVSRNSWGQSVR
jgi:predicted HTH transcriptional regulator